jgi:hypothetical protein
MGINKFKVSFLNKLDTDKSIAFFFFVMLGFFFQLFVEFIKKKNLKTISSTIYCGF